MSAERCRKIKGVVLIALLVGLEARHAHQNILFHARSNSKLGSASQVSGADSDHGVQAERVVAAAHAAEAEHSNDMLVDKLVDNVVSKLFDRPLKATLRKSSHLAVQTVVPASSARLHLPNAFSKSHLALAHHHFVLHHPTLAVHAIDKLEKRLERVGSAVDRLPPDERKSVEEAAEKLGGRVTVGDVAATAGVPLDVAERALQALALDSEGALEISSDGQIVYALPTDFRSRVAGKSLRSKIEPAAEKAGAALSYVTRVGFGTCLVASVVVVATALIAVTIATSQSQREERRSEGGVEYITSTSYYGGGGGWFSGPSFYMTPFDLMYPLSPGYYESQQQMVTEKKMGFLPSVFSFVFGDGNPNFDLEERRWEAVADAIVRRDGVIIAEELAPYLDGPGAGAMKNVDDDFAQLEEGYVLEVLQRFNGETIVSDEGHLIYRFPSLMTSAGGKANPYAGMPLRELKERAEDLDVDTAGMFDRESIEKALAKVDDEQEELEPTLYLYEEPWQFSGSSPDQKIAVVGLGLLNIVGIVALAAQLANPKVLYLFARAYPAFAKFIIWILPILKVYAIFLVIFPLIRLALNWWRNKQIEARNVRRIKSAQRLVREPALQAKMQVARAASQAQPVRREVSQSDIVFDSSTPIQEVESKNAFDDFDKRLQGSSSDSEKTEEAAFDEFDKRLQGSSGDSGKTKEVGYIYTGDSGKASGGGKTKE